MRIKGLKQPTVILDNCNVLLRFTIYTSHNLLARCKAAFDRIKSLVIKTFGFFGKVCFTDKNLYKIYLEAFKDLPPFVEQSIRVIVLTVEVIMMKLRFYLLKCCISSFSVGACNQAWPLGQGHEDQNFRADLSLLSSN